MGAATAHRWTPLPWQVPVTADRSPLLLLTGSAGGGKSRLAAELLHRYCLDYPGSTALMLRKTRESMNNATLLFVRRKIVGKEAVFFQSYHRFEYANGSVLAYGGMKDEEQREQVRGIGQDGGVDIVWMEEATQFDEADYNEVLARNRAKAGPYRQIILSTNPDAPTHWIYNRLIVGGESKVYYSNVADNPYNPPDYVETLAKITGVESQRLVKGQWVQASGLVFDVWSDGPPDGNVTEAAEYQEGAGDVVWIVDDGYAGSQDPNTGHFTADSHPRAILLVQVKPDGHLDIFAESYAIKRLSHEHIAEVKAAGYPDPVYAILGPGSAEIGGELHKAGIYTRRVQQDVEETIKEARKMLAPDSNGFRRIRAHPRVKHLRSEMASYRRDPVTGKVIKQFDHGCFVSGTMIITRRGNVCIESIKIGDEALTRNGYRRVIACGMTNPKAGIVGVDFSNGRSLLGTSKHPVFVSERGFVPIDELRYGDKIVTYQQRMSLCLENVLPNQNRYSLMGSSLGAIPILERGLIGFISGRAARMFFAASKTITASCGNFITGLSPLGMTFITETTTRSTMQLTTWNAYLEKNINTVMETKPRVLNTSWRDGRIWKRPALSPQSGTLQTMAGNGIPNTPKKYGGIASRLLESVTIAVRRLSRLPADLRIGFVQTIASLPSGENQELTTLSVYVKTAAIILRSIVTQNRNVAQVHVRQVYATGTERPVFNLTVEGESEYFANGILVHNCDDIRYLAWDKRHG